MSGDDHLRSTEAMLMSESDRRLAAALRDLPPKSPPADVWERIRHRAETEGILGRPRERRMRRDLQWLAGGALAATVVFSLLDLSVLGPDPAPSVPADEGRFAATPVENGESLGGLMHRSRMLEQALRSARSQPRVMRASTASTIATLEDRITLIDQQLSFPQRRLTEEEEKALWRERVQLMNSLVQLRYAQARRVVL